MAGSATSATSKPSPVVAFGGAPSSAAAPLAWKSSSYARPLLLPSTSSTRSAPPAAATARSTPPSSGVVSAQPGSWTTSATRARTASSTVVPTPSASGGT